MTGKILIEVIEYIVVYKQSRDKQSINIQKNFFYVTNV